MKLERIAAVIAILAAGLCGGAAAENMMLYEIVVPGEKEKLNEETLTMREVKESPARDVGEALAQAPGVDMVRKGAIASDVALRGFQRDNINVLFDGARLHGACPDRMDPPSFHYDFAQIEKIEIVKGPYDLSNPGGMGGMINAVGRRPVKANSAGLNLSYGSYDSVNASAEGSSGSEEFYALAGYAFKYSKVPKSGDGKRITDIYPASSANRYRPEAHNSRAYDVSTTWGRAGFDTAKNSRAEFAYSYQDAQHVLSPYLLMDAEFDRTNLFNAAYKASDVTEELKEVSAQIYLDRVDHLMDDRHRLSSAPGGAVTRAYSAQSAATAGTFGAKLQATADVWKGSLRAGGDYYRRNWEVVSRRALDSAYAPSNTIPDANIYNAGLFVEYDQPVSDRWVMKGGVRGDVALARAEKGNAAVPAGDKQHFGEVSADAQLTFAPSNHLELFAGLARGARLPDQKELYLSIPNTGTAPPGNKNTFGDPNLKAAINYEGDVGAKYSTAKLHVKASAFYSALQNYITLTGFTSAGPVNELTYANVDAVIWGAEAGAQVSLPADLILSGNFSYTWGRNSSGERALPEMPPLKGAAALRYYDGTLMLEAAERFAARQNRVDTLLLEAKTPGWAVTDLKAGYARKGLSFYAGVNNLFDKFYYTHLSFLRDPFASGVKVPENGRNFYVTASWRY